MRTVIVLLWAGLAGCATSHPRVMTSLATAPAAVKESVADRATVAEATQYELGRYRYPADDSESGTTVVRVTRVPPRVAMKVSMMGESPSYDPLPQSAELAVELATQQQITEKIRSIQLSVVAAEQKAKEQYAVLVAQREAVAKLRSQLEAEHARLIDVEAQLHAEAPAENVKPNISTPASTSTEDVKW